MLNLRIFGLEFENIVVMIHINVLDIALLQSLVQKQKCLNLGSKMSYFGIFGLKLEKTVVIFEISTLKFV